MWLLGSAAQVTWYYAACHLRTCVHAPATSGCALAFFTWEPIPHHTHESGSLSPSYHCLSSLLRLALSPTLTLTPTPTLVLYSPNHTLTLALTLTLTLTRRHPFSPPSSFVSMLSLLVLLAPVGAAGTCTLTRSGRNGPLFSVLSVHPTVPLSCPKPYSLFPRPPLTNSWPIRRSGSWRATGPRLAWSLTLPA